MRQIDADALIPLIQKDKIEGETLNIIRALGDGLQAETLNQACDRHIKMINSLPTIEAEPKHGQWVFTPTTGRYRCSACEKEDKIIPWGKPPFDYCPNCGAKMDGTEK